MSEKLATIETQGEVVVNSCSLEYDYEDVKILSLDLRTKYAVIAGYGGNSVILGTDNRTMYKSEKHDGFTEITFPRFEGFGVWAGDVGRYSCTVALVREGVNWDTEKEGVFFKEVEVG